MPGALERQRHARDVQRGRVGEDVALGERPGLGVAVAQARDAVVEQPAARAPAGPRAAPRTRRSGWRPRARSCRCSRSRRSARRRPRGRGSPSRGSRRDRRGPPSATRRRASSAWAGESVIPTARTPWRSAAWITKLPQPQPTSSTRSPSCSASLRQTSSRLASCASSRVREAARAGDAVPHDCSSESISRENSAQLYVIDSSRNSAKNSLETS